MGDSYPAILDGGLATELEHQGYALDDTLWSARLLLESPETISSVHLAYLQAGADYITTASYQATITGFVRAGISEPLAIALLQRSVRLARGQRDLFWREAANRSGRTFPRVACSVGPYGAYLANGSEYTGNYRLDRDGLIAFHRRRWSLLADEKPDVMLCETIPSMAEVRVLADLAAETVALPTWISLSCRDAGHLCDGTPIRDVAMFLNEQPAVRSIGVNCVPPALVSDLIGEVRNASDKPVVVYPNSGESWDAGQKKWIGRNSLSGFAELAKLWRRQGADVIGGCCRTGPDHIRMLRKTLRND